MTSSLSSTNGVVRNSPQSFNSMHSESSVSKPREHCGIFKKIFGLCNCAKIAKTISECISRTTATGSGEHVGDNFSFFDLNDARDEAQSVLRD